MRDAGPAPGISQPQPCFAGATEGGGVDDASARAELEVLADGVEEGAVVVEGAVVIDGPVVAVVLALEAGRSDAGGTGSGEQKLATTHSAPLGHFSPRSHLPAYCHEGAPRVPCARSTRQ
jgi:hypothetical protein